MARDEVTSHIAREFGVNIFSTSVEFSWTFDWLLAGCAVSWRRLHRRVSAAWRLGPAPGLQSGVWVRPRRCAGPGGRGAARTRQRVSQKRARALSASDRYKDMEANYSKTHTCTRRPWSGEAVEARRHPSGLSGELGLQRGDCPRDDTFKISRPLQGLGVSQQLPDVWNYCNPWCLGPFRN